MEKKKTKKQPPTLPTPTAEQFLSLNEAYQYFNRILFHGKLPGCILNFSRKAGTHGFMAPERWRRVGEKTYSTHEISLTPTTLYRPPIEVFSTLVHEQCHLWQWEFGNPSRNGYHNKEWALKMIEIGLMPVPADGKPPHDRITGQAMTHTIIPGGMYERAFGVMPEEYLLPFTSLEGDLMKSLLTGAAGSDPEGGGTGSGVSAKVLKLRPTSKNKVKYTCPNCKTNVWGKPALRVQCLDCNEQFEGQE